MKSMNRFERQKLSLKPIRGSRAASYMELLEFENVDKNLDVWIDEEPVCIVRLIRETYPSASAVQIAGVLHDMGVSVKTDLIESILAGIRCG